MTALALFPAGYSAVTTEDGTIVVRDLDTGMVASGRTLVDALADLRRLLAARKVAA